MNMWSYVFMLYCHVFWQVMQNYHLLELCKVVIDFLLGSQNQKMLSMIKFFSSKRKTVVYVLPNFFFWKYHQDAWIAFFECFQLTSSTNCGKLCNSESDDLKWLGTTWHFLTTMNFKDIKAAVRKFVKTREVDS